MSDDGAVAGAEARTAESAADPDQIARLQIAASCTALTRSAMDLATNQAAMTLVVLERAEIR